MNPIKICERILSRTCLRTSMNYSLLLETSLQSELDILRDARGFEPKEWIEEKSVILNEYMSNCGLKAIAINLSGGVDSSVTFALVNYAMEKPESTIERLVGISQPIHSTAKITDRSFLLENYGEIITVDQSNVFDELLPLIENPLNVEGDVFQRGQLKSYMRTPVVYYVAQLLSMSGYPAAVMGTGNFDEDGYLYYFCKAGDGVADLQIINELHKFEVFQVGYELGLPEDILGAPPSADLWDGQTDEDELGFPYDFVELYTEYLELGENEKFAMFDRLTPDGMYQFKSWEELIQKVHNSNSHKETYPINLNIERFDLRSRNINLCSEVECKCISPSSSTTTTQQTQQQQQDEKEEEEGELYYQYCPVCEKRVEKSSIYPDYVCLGCMENTQDKEGRRVFFQCEDDPVKFFTVIKGYYYDDGDEKVGEEVYEDLTCYIDGVECLVEIAVFGGKVITPL